MIFGYARCSTNEDKQDIERQKRELRQLGATDETIYCEYESGTKADRTELNKLLAIVHIGDVIVTTEVSRITRSTKQLCEIIELCKEKHLKLVIKDSITIDCTKGTIDPMTNAFLQMSGVFAELERNIISERVKSGLQNARAKGVALGREKTTKSDIPPIFFKYYKDYKNGVFSKTEFSRLTGLSRPTIYKYLALLDDEE